MNCKKILLAISIIILGIVLIKITGVKTMKNEENLIFKTGDKASNEYFTGDAWVNMMIADPKENDLTVYNVTFNPGARTFWHKHDVDQILLITHGRGYYQEKGKPAQELKPGDVVQIPANAVHWHGAAKDSKFIHVGMTPQATKNKVWWLGEVTDEEYNGI